MNALSQRGLLVIAAMFFCLIIEMQLDFINLEDFSSWYDSMKLP